MLIACILGGRGLNTQHYEYQFQRLSSHFCIFSLSSNTEFSQPDMIFWYTKEALLYKISMRSHLKYRLFGSLMFQADTSRLEKVQIRDLTIIRAEVENTLFLQITSFTCLALQTESQEKPGQLLQKWLHWEGTKHEYVKGQ